MVSKWNAMPFEVMASPPAGLATEVDVMTRLMGCRSIWYAT